MAPPLRSFPQDLAAAQLARHLTCRELAALYGRLPRYAVSAAAWIGPDGTAHPAAAGWSETDHAAVEELLDRERELRAAIAGDPFWTTAAHGETSSPRALPALRMGALEQAA